MKAMIVKKIKDNRFELMEIDIDGLRDMIAAVDGTISAFDYSQKLFENHIDSYCNDEGKLRHLTPSIAVFNKGQLVDVVCGNVLFTGVDDNGKTISLTEKQKVIIKEVLSPGYLCTKEQTITCYKMTIDY